MKPRHVAILGAGPIGLEAALAAAEHGLSLRCYEAAAAVAGNIRSWGHVQLFTPWSMNVSPRVRAALDAAGQSLPDGDACPTGAEMVDRLLEPLEALPTLAPHICLQTRVVEVGRDGLLKNDAIGMPSRGDRPFRLLLEDAQGAERVEYADIVLDCTGTYHHPNALGASGVHAPGERGLSEDIIRGIPDLDALAFEGDASGWGGQRILLVGAGHSAQTTARDLEGLVRQRPDTIVVWAIRNASPTFGVVEDDELPSRDVLARHARRLALEETSPFDVRLGCTVEAVERSATGIVVSLRRESTDVETVVVDRIVSLTGSVGDARLYRQLQVHECWATSGPMRLAAALLASPSTDCLTQGSHGADTLRNPEPNFFILGSKSYGRNTTFLLRVGWQQVEEVFSLIGATVLVAGDNP